MDFHSYRMEKGTCAKEFHSRGMMLPWAHGYSRGLGAKDKMGKY